MYNIGHDTGFNIILVQDITRLPVRILFMGSSPFIFFLEFNAFLFTINVNGTTDLIKRDESKTD